MFIHVQSLFNNGRSNGEIVLLPQVIYRYFKILTTVAPISLLYFRAVWELLTFVVSLLLLYLYRRKMTVSALIFCIGAILLPTLSGTLSSFPYSMATLGGCFNSLPSRFIAHHSDPVWYPHGSVALFVQGIFIA
jgi:hypothetical protein